MRDDLVLLRKCAMLTDLSDDAIRAVLSAGIFIKFKAGDTVMREGEESDTMYLFLEGAVDVTRNLTLKVAGRGFERAEKSMVRLKAGTAPVFGEMSMFGDEPRSATITAAADCVLFEMSRASFEDLCGREPGLGLVLTKRIAVILSGRVRKGNDDVLKLSTALSIALTR